MPQTPKLTENQIRAWTDTSSFARGQRYYAEGAILSPRRQENTLKAECYGSLPQPYRLEVTLGDTGIVSGHCSCPVGGGGRCKHAVALMLTWLHEPESFTEVAALEEMLIDRSQDELIALILKMVDRHPDLETLLELPTPAQASSTPLDPELIRRQVRTALRDTDYGYGAGYAVAQDLEQILAQGDEYAEAGDYANAVIVYETVARMVLDDYEMLPDEEGEVSGMADSCAEGLATCLDAADDPALRLRILETLFYIYKWDIDYGGIGVGDSAYVALMEETTPDEKAQVADWVRAALPAGDGDDFSRNWQRQVYGGLLLELGEEELDDEAFLRICRETGRTHDLVERLLALGRTEEAVAATREVSDYTLLTLTERFEKAGQGDLAEQLIRQRLPQSTDRRLTQWLIDRLRKQSTGDEALDWAVQLFDQQATLGYYQQIREIAETAGRWQPLRRELLARLENEQRFHLLVQIYLEEDLVDEALQALAQLTKEQRPHFGYMASGPLRIQVAQAAEEKRPHAAIDIYVDAAERLIAARGRDNYATAAQYLKRIQAIYQRLSEDTHWQTLIDRIRNENRNLPALRDELKKAGL